MIDREREVASTNVHNQKTFTRVSLSPSFLPHVHVYRTGNEATDADSHILHSPPPTRRVFGVMQPGTGRELPALFSPIINQIAIMSSTAPVLVRTLLF